MNYSVFSRTHCTSPMRQISMMLYNKGVIGPICRSCTAIHPTQRCDMRSTHTDINQHETTIPTIKVLLYVFSFTNLILQHFNLISPLAHINDLRGENAILGKLFVKDIHIFLRYSIKLCPLEAVCMTE